MLAAAVLTLALLPRDADNLPELCRNIPARTTSVELAWSQPAPASQVRSLPSSHDWKQFYANWLKVKYQYQIAKLNEAYGTEFTSFTDLTESTFPRLDTQRPAVRADDPAFQSELETYILGQLQPGCPSSVTSVAWKRSRT